MLLTVPPPTTPYPPNPPPSSYCYGFSDLQTRMDSSATWVWALRISMRSTADSHTDKATLAIPAHMLSCT